MIRDPRDMPIVFARTFNERDLEGLVRLYTDDAVFVANDGSEARGAGIRQALEGFLALPGPIKMTMKRAVIGLEHAVLVNQWSLPHGLTGTSTEVLVRTEDGWRYTIDAPFGLQG